MKEKLLAFFIEKIAKKKLGVDIQIELLNTSVKVDDNNTKIYLDGGIVIKNSDLKKILEEKL